MMGMDRVIRLCVQWILSDAVVLPPEYAVREGEGGPPLISEGVAWMPRPFSYQVLEFNTITSICVVFMRRYGL